MENTATREPRLQRIAPATDIIEREDGFHILMDMPGVRKDDLVIDLDRNEMTVSGAAQNGPELCGQVGRSCHHAEFGGTEYARSFTLSDNVDRERISAQFKDGVLDLFLPKSEKAKPRKIEITAG